MSEDFCTHFGNETTNSFPTLTAEETETRLFLLKKSLMDVDSYSYNEDIVQNVAHEYATLFNNISTHQNPYPDTLEVVHTTSSNEPSYNIPLEELVGNEPRGPEVPLFTPGQDRCEDNSSTSWIDNIIFSYSPSLPPDTVSEPDGDSGHHRYAHSPSSNSTPTFRKQHIEITFPKNNPNVDVVANAPSNNTPLAEIVGNEPRRPEVNSSKLGDINFGCYSSPYTPSLPPVTVSEPDANSGPYHHFYIGNPSSTSSSIVPKQHIDASIPERISTASISKRKKMLEVATSAMSELIKLAQTKEPLWFESALDERQVLDIKTYRTIFGRKSYLRDSRFRGESSKFSGLLMMDAISLVGIFMDLKKWMQYFYTIVADAKIIQVLASGTEGSPDGTLQTISQYLHVLSPLVPLRRQNLLRYCKEIEQGLWAVVDVSYDANSKHGNNYTGQKLPSGCLIQDMPNGCAKVTWIEHLEALIEPTTNQLFKVSLLKGVSYGAERWVSILKRVNEKMEFIPMTFSSNLAHIGEVISTSKGRKNLMKFCEIMMNEFCTAVSPCNNDTWNTLSKLDDIVIRASIDEETEFADEGLCILNAITSICIQQSPEKVFNFLRNAKNRYKWDAQYFGHSLEEVAYMVTGSDPRNCVSILEDKDLDKNKKMILQESSTDGSGRSFVVYSPIDVDIMDTMMTAEHPSGMKFLPSGFVVIPSETSQPSRNTTSSIVTLAMQTILGNLQSIRLTPKAIDVVRGHLKAISEALKMILKD